AAGTEEREELPRLHLQADVVDRAHAGEVHGEVLDHEACAVLRAHSARHSWTAGCEKPGGPSGPPGQVGFGLRPLGSGLLARPVQRVRIMMSRHVARYSSRLAAAA